MVGDVSPEEYTLYIQEKNLPPLIAFCVGATLMVSSLVFMITACVDSRKKATVAA